MDAVNPAGRGKISAADAPASKVNAAAGNSICVVDDDDSVRDSLTTLLETHGFDVLAYGSGREFLADERRRNAACLILDQHMPGLDGLDTLAGLRADGIVTPAILVSGRSDQMLIERAKSLQVIAILEKPFSVSRLLDLVRATRNFAC